MPDSFYQRVKVNSNKLKSVADKSAALFLEIIFFLSLKIEKRELTIYGKNIEIFTFKIFVCGILYYT